MNSSNIAQVNGITELSDTKLTQCKMFALLDKDIAFKDLDDEWKKS